jgi:hypothetical protein
MALISQPALGDKVIRVFKVGGRVVACPVRDADFDSARNVAACNSVAFWASYTLDLLWNWGISSVGSHLSAIVGAYGAGRFVRFLLEQRLGM